MNKLEKFERIECIDLDEVYGAVPARWRGAGEERDARDLLTRHYCQSIGRYLSEASRRRRAPDTRDSSL